jgi:hypothetical protein
MEHIIERLTARVTDHKPGRMIQRKTGWRVRNIEQITERRIEWWVDGIIYRSIDKGMLALLNEWLIGRNNWIIDRMIERPIEWTMERMTERVIDLMTDRGLLHTRVTTRADVNFQLRLFYARWRANRILIWFYKSRYTQTHIKWSLGFF